MVGDEIPLLSWSLHLLGEAEWAGAVGAAFGFSSCASLRLILVLKLVRSSSAAGLCSRFGLGGGAVKSVFSPLGRGYRPPRERKLSRGAIRAEDIAGWGV